MFPTIDQKEASVPVQPSMSAKLTSIPLELRPASSVPFLEVEDNPTRPSVILIVDGEEINRRLLKAIFKTASYRILEARKASEAIELLQSEKIDLVILDLRLPEMSGPELSRWMKASRQTQFVPLLLATTPQVLKTQITAL